MVTLDCKIAQLVGPQYYPGEEQTAETFSCLLPREYHQPQPDSSVSNRHLDLDLGDALIGFSHTDEDFDFSQLFDLRPEELFNDLPSNSPLERKRKAASEEESADWKKSRQQFSNSDSYNSLLSFHENNAALGSTHLHTGLPSSGQDTGSSDSCYNDPGSPISPEIHDTSPVSSCSNASEELVDGQSVEYHFKKIQEHVKAAVDALRHGRYERNKNIVTWAHELKNRTFSELKKEAEQAWNVNKEKDTFPAYKPKPMHGSTKRVEQFRKNMRRWMIGIQAHQVGVEWMVYARMEHLLTISKYILGDALPIDPASPTAVSESIVKYLGYELPPDFVESQLAEPEPGKRYAIGSELSPHLQAKCCRQVPTLAFTMPPDGDDLALGTWLSNLKALFPQRPAPKIKGSLKASC